MIEYKEVTLNVEDIGKGMQVLGSRVATILMDGRNISAWSEEWAASLFNLKRSPNSNQKGYDLFLDHEIFKGKVAVRTLTNKVLFQQSKNIGSGRTCNMSDLINAIKKIDYQIVVDINTFPKIRFYVLSKDFLVEKIKNKELTKNGWAYKKFHKMIA